MDSNHQHHVPKYVSSTRLRYWSNDSFQPTKTIKSPLISTRTLIHHIRYLRMTLSRDSRPALKSLRRDSNPQLAHYKWATLPLSHVGIQWAGKDSNLRCFSCAWFTVRCSRRCATYPYVCEAQPHLSSVHSSSLSIYIAARWWDLCRGPSARPKSLVVYRVQL